MTYRETIDLVNTQLVLLTSKFGISPKKDSWVNEAIKLTHSLIEAEKSMSQAEYFKSEDYLYDRTLTSLAELINLRDILNSLQKIDEKNVEVFLKKLKIVFAAPLLLKDESLVSNEGKNIRFELRLFSRFMERDYDVHLSLDHPDISVDVGKNRYYIECKRIFMKERLLDNAKDAIDQLVKYSLDKSGYGIVALSVTRYFHSGDKRLEAITEEAAKKRIEYEMDNLLREYKDKLFNMFPLRIPALFLEFSDRVAADKAYSMNLIDIIDTANGRPSLFHKIRKDFNGLYKKF